jgi:hypothetical protein
MIWMPLYPAPQHSSHSALRRATSAATISAMLWLVMTDGKENSSALLAAPNLATINAQYQRGDCNGVTSSIGQYLRQRVAPSDAARAWRILGICAARLGKTDVATRNFKTALGFDRTLRLSTQEASDQRVSKAFGAAGGNPVGVAAKPTAPAQTQASTRAAAKASMLKQTTLTVRSNVPGALVKQDGIILGPAGSTFEVDPGNLVIEVSASGYQSKKVRMTARRNTANQMTVNLEKVVIKATPRPNPRPAPASTAKSVASRSSDRDSAQRGKSTSGRGSQLFGDDFAGTVQSPPQARQGQSAVRPPSRGKVKSPTYDQGYDPGNNPGYDPGYAPSGGGYAGTSPQPYQPGPAYSPGYNPGFNQGVPPPVTQPYGQPYAQPYAQPPYAPGYPSYPGYGGYPAAPYSPGYPQQPLYQQPAPVPYYYYPQTVAPPIAQPAPQVVVPMDPISTPPLSDAPLPSVAEAPDLSSPPPVIEDPEPKVGTTRKSQSTARSPFVKYLPFGAGQYQNGNTLLGVAFTAGQAGALVLYMMNSSNAAKGQENYQKSMDQSNNAEDDETAEAYFKDAENWKSYHQQSSQNATLCLIGFGAAYAASVIEASLHTPSKGKSRRTGGRRRGFAFDSGMGASGLEAQLSYNF